MKGIVEVNPVMIHSTHNLCIRPYPNHKKGCPNYGKKKGCPPGIPIFDSVYDLSKPVYAIYNKFNFKEHVDRMKEKHPDWSKRQLECCLYWQGAARKELNTEIKIFHGAMLGWAGVDYNICTCPEALGINVTETMKKVGIILEWPPVNVVYKIAVAGILKIRIGGKINGKEITRNSN